MCPMIPDNEKGVALLTVLAIVLLLTFIGTVTVMTSKTVSYTHLRAHET